jgi:hypothetical protein
LKEKSSEEAYEKTKERRDEAVTISKERERIE